MPFTQEEINRYTRQMMMEGWGEETQKKIKNSTVFIAGAGLSCLRQPEISRA